MRATSLALLSLGLTLTSPLWLHVEPSPVYPAGAVWPQLIYASGHFVLVAAALCARRTSLSSISLLHAAWLITAQIAFSTQGEIWSALQLLFSNVSALVCVSLWWMHRRAPAENDELGRYALACLLGAALVFAGLTTARSAADASEWALVHGEAARVVEHLRAQGDVQTYEARFEWASREVRTERCEGGGYRVFYGGSASHTYHLRCGARPDGWFYYED